MDYKAVYEILKSKLKTDQLLQDPNQTAHALLSLKHVILDAKEGLAYSLMALCTLLTKSKSAWSVLDQQFTDQLVSIAAFQEQQPNVLCPALSIISLIALESKHKEKMDPEQCPDLVRSFNHDQTFIPVLVSRLTSSHVQTVFVSLQTINSMLVGLFLTPERKNHIYCSLREADLFRSAAFLIENKPVSSTCRPQLYDLQEIIKAAIRKTKRMKVDPANNVYHKLTYDATEMHLRTLVGVIEHTDKVDWEKAGIPQNIHPVELINQMEACWAGMLDFNDFFNEDKLGFKKIFLEQMTFTKPNARFPLIKSSMAITNILYDIFRVDQETISQDLLDGKVDTLQPPSYIKVHQHSSDDSESVISDSSQSVEKIMTTMDNLRPLFFDWTSLHFSGISNFMRLWQSSCAEVDDFANIQQVVRILFEKATQHAITASSSSAIENVISKLDFISYDEVRSTQLKQIENKTNDKWGEEIRHLHRMYLKESEDFVREQRVRLLLNGDWFFIDDPTMSILNKNSSPNNFNNSQAQQQRAAAHQNINPNRRYFIALSPSRKSLQYSQFPQKQDNPPAAELLTRSIDLTSVNKVLITPITQASPVHAQGLKRVSLSSRTNYTKISLIGSSGSRDGATLNFYSDTPEKAAAWGDGLLMLKNRAFQTSDTKKFIEMFADSKLRIQMLNLTSQEVLSPHKHAPLDLDGEFDRSQISTDFYYKS